jgi:hypothetical protein
VSHLSWGRPDVAVGGGVAARLPVGRNQAACIRAAVALAIRLVASSRVHYRGTAGCKSDGKKREETMSRDRKRTGATN